MQIKGDKTVVDIDNQRIFNAEFELMCICELKIVIPVGDMLDKCSRCGRTSSGRFWLFGGDDYHSIRGSNQDFQGVSESAEIAKAWACCQTWKMGKNGNTPANWVQIVDGAKREVIFSGTLGEDRGMPCFIWSEGNFGSLRLGGKIAKSKRTCQTEYGRL